MTRITYPKWLPRAFVGVAAAAALNVLVLAALVLWGGDWSVIGAAGLLAVLFFALAELLGVAEEIKIGARQGR